MLTFKPMSSSVRHTRIAAARQICQSVSFTPLSPTALRHQIPAPTPPSPFPPSVLRKGEEGWCHGSNFPTHLGSYNAVGATMGLTAPRQAPPFPCVHPHPGRRNTKSIPSPNPSEQCCTSKHAVEGEKTTFFPPKKHH